MFRLFGYEISFRRETSGWIYEDFDHSWEYILRIEYVSPYEKKHRASLEERRKEKPLIKAANSCSNRGFLTPPSHSYSLNMTTGTLY